VEELPPVPAGDPSPARRADRPVSPVRARAGGLLRYAFSHRSSQANAFSCIAALNSCGPS
jgi:hypothetical protein